MTVDNLNLKGRTIVLGITGSIAAYKSADLCSRLKEAGAIVYPILTDSACRFIQPLTLQILSKNPALTDLWYESEHNHPNHIQIADSADLLLVAPASANCIGLFAQGLAPDLLSTIHLATQAPVLIAPAMNGKMYDHPATQENMKVLRDRNYHFVEPEEGLLACGYVGLGKLAKVETILEKVKDLL
ncbi:MAG: flavoprotein [Coraliomargaritaceae bacterium]